MTERASTVTVLGCGYVGLTTAAVLANCGVKVYALEILPKRLAAIKEGRSFFHEVGINPLIAAGLKNGNLIPTDSYDESVPQSDIVFSCVGTPDHADGSSNLHYVHDAAIQAAALMKDEAIFVQKSTVPVGTGRQLESIFEQAGRSLRYVSNPEFLSESTAIADTLWYDRIVAGSDDAAAAEAVIAVYKRIEAARDHIASIADLTPPKQPVVARYIVTSQESAEMIKVSSNAFLALKISFANSIAKLADRAGADVTEVMDAVGADRRIGRAFLNAGRGYGGGCFPKDVSGLIRSAEDYGADMEVMRAATSVNDSMPHYVINKAEERIGGPLKDKKVAVLGIAFKSGTSDVRRSPGITIANSLATHGAHVRVHDPAALDEAHEAGELEAGITRYKALADAVKDAEIIFITTDWPEYLKQGLDGLKQSAGEPLKLIVDAMNCFDKPADGDVSYIGVGR